MIFTTPSAFKMLSFTPDHKVRKWVVKRISHDDDAPSLSAFLAWKSIEQKLPVDMTKTFPPSASDLSLKLSNNKHPMKIMTVVKKILTIIFVNICTPRHAQQQHSLRARAAQCRLCKAGTQCFDFILRQVSRLRKQTRLCQVVT